MYTRNYEAHEEDGEGSMHIPENYSGNAFSPAAEPCDPEASRPDPHAPREGTGFPPARGGLLGRLGGDWELLLLILLLCSGEVESKREGEDTSLLLLLLLLYFT